MSASDPPPPEQIGALILAGRRGPDDPLAAAAGAEHRALLEVAGIPTLQRVVDTLLRCGRIARVVVSIDAPELLNGIPRLAELVSRRDIEVIESASSPSRCVLAGLARFSTEESVLVTAADHALLDDEMLGHFLEAAQASGADLSLAMVAATRIRARFPDSKRTYLALRGESYSGANLFLFRTEASRRAAEFWIRAEQFRKQPWRLVSFFGLGSLLLFATRRLDLEAAMQRASKAVGVRIHAVEMPQAEAAIDVDTLEDLHLADRLLRERQQR